MSSLPSIHEGSISAKPFGNTLHGRVAGSPEAPTRGTLRGSSEGGVVSAEPSDSPENSAVAELGGLISSLGSLSAQAQSLPLSAPALPGPPQGQNYRPQPTDYTQFVDDSN